MKAAARPDHHDRFAGAAQHDVEGGVIAAGQAKLARVALQAPGRQRPVGADSGAATVALREHPGLRQMLIGARNGGGGGALLAGQLADAGQLRAEASSPESTCAAMAWAMSRYRVTGADSTLPRTRLGGPLASRPILNQHRRGQS